MTGETETRVGDLFDVLANAPEGLKLPELAAQLELDNHQVTRLIRQLRRTFRDDTVNLICEPNGQGEYWTYRLVGRLEDQRSWVAWRVLNVEAQLETIEAVTASAINASDGRTVEGRKARYINMAIRHLLEQVGFMGGGGDQPTLF